MQQTAVRIEYKGTTLRKQLCFCLLLPLGYLCQVCIMPYCSIGGMVPNLLYVLIGIITVAYGKLRVFWAGMFYGLLMELMLPSATCLNLGLYTLTSVICCFVFADKSQRQQSYNEAVRKNQKSMPAWLRTVLCTGANMLLYEGANLVYIIITGTNLTAGHIGRSLISLSSTTLLCFLLQFPLRRVILGKKLTQKAVQSAPVVFEKK